MMMKDFSRRKRVHFKSQPDDVAPPSYPWEGIDRVNDLEATDVLSKLRLEGPIDVRTDIETEWTMDDETNSCPIPDCPSASQEILEVCKDNKNDLSHELRWRCSRWKEVIKNVFNNENVCRNWFSFQNWRMELFRCCKQKVIFVKFGFIF